MATLLASSPSVEGLQAYQPVHDFIERHAGEYVEEVRRFLRIPGFSDTGEGIRLSAQACLDYVRMVGSVEAKIVETPLHPIVFGKLYSKDPNAKTIMAYSLYDQTPADPAEWASHPLGAEIIDPTRIGLPRELGSVICNRAAHNQRGPMLSFILALQAMKEVTGDIPVNVVWLWEGEEEIGSPSLPGFLQQYGHEYQACQAMYCPSMRQNWYGPMVIPRGYKGGVVLELECKGGEWGGSKDGRHIWAGHVPWVDAPLMRLIHAVGSLYGEDHTVRIDGVDPLIQPLSEQDRAELEQLKQGFNNDLERMMKAVIGVHRFRGGKSVPELMERWVSSLALNIQGIVGGYIGPSFYTAAPQTASAKMDFRVPPGVEADRLLELLRAHLDRRGFTEIQIKNQRGYECQRTPTEHPIIQAGIKAAAMHGVPTVVWPTTNAFCPAGLFARPPLNLASSWVGLGHGERPHQPDEYICVDAVAEYMKFAVTYLNEWVRM